MKQLLIVLGLILIMHTFAQEKKNFDDNLRYKRVVKVGNTYLIQTERYKYLNRSYIYAYKYLENDSLYKIKENTEILKIEQNKDFYFCLLKKDSIIELLKSSKKSIKWKSIYKISDNSRFFSLTVSDDNVLVCSDTKIYHNLKNKNKFNIFIFRSSKTKSLPEYSNFIRSSTFCFCNNIFYIGSNFGEWGGGLTAYCYNKKTNDFIRQGFPTGNVIKLIPKDGCVYALTLLDHMGSLCNALYKIDNSKLETIIYLNYDNFIMSSKTKVSKDIYNWKDTLDNSSILNMTLNDNDIFFVIQEKGIYKWTSDNKLKLIQPLSINNYYIEEKGESRFQYDNRAKDIEIIDNTFFVIHNLPFITSIKNNSFP